MDSWTIFFMFKPYTTIHTTVLTEDFDEYYNKLTDKELDNLLIKIARQKIIDEMGLDVFELAEKLGKNDNFGKGWIAVEGNGDATDTELERIKSVKKGDEKF